MRKTTSLGACASLILFTAGPISLNAQQSPFPGISYAKGQDVSPTFDGWESNPDGTFTMYFGYLNRNSQEEVDVPIGPENTFDLGNGDQGQPSHFYQGRRGWVFNVVVPKDWPRDKRLVWTLTNRGRTNQAKGWLEPEWEVDKLLISKDHLGDPFLAGGGENPDVVGDPPVITGGPAQTITLPATATLTATATDYGLPKSGPGERAQGVRIRWILYRGAGKVQFDPDVSPAVNGKPVTLETQVTFNVPGNYRIRAIASNGQLFSTCDVDVKVNPSSSGEKAR
jgi:hypothetical protein